MDAPLTLYKTSIKNIPKYIFTIENNNNREILVYDVETLTNITNEIESGNITSLEGALKVVKNKNSWEPYKYENKLFVVNGEKIAYWDEKSNNFYDMNGVMIKNVESKVRIKLPKIFSSNGEYKLEENKVDNDIETKMDIDKKDNQLTELVVLNNNNVNQINELKAINNNNINQINDLKSMLTSSNNQVNELKGIVNELRK